MERGRVLADRYELEEELGSGGAAVVWRALDQLLDRTVAVKLLHRGRDADERSVDRFRREARSAATLNHRNAVAIYDIGSDGDETFIVMEYVDGPSLGDLLEGRPLEPSLVTAVGYQVAAALGAAHVQGLIHRDVKPANILLSATGHAKVADFGIAKAIDSPQTTLTQAGTVIGTVAYLAPEQIRGGPVDPRADVYALGLVLFEALTGDPPFGEGTPAEVTARRLAADPPPLGEVRPDLPRPLAAAVTRATRLDPDARFANAVELAECLEQLLDDDPEAVLRRFVGRERRNRPRADDTQVLTGLDADASETVAIARPGGSPDGSEGRERAPMIPAGGRRPLVAAVVVLAVLLGTWSVVAGGDGGDGDGEGGDGSGQSEVLAVDSAHDFDPFGDGEEHREDTANAYDGDAGTAWVTERYDSADMGGLKPGVGLFFDLGDVHDLARIELTVSPDIGFEVRVGSSAPRDGEDPSGWGAPVHEVDGADESVVIDLGDDVRGRYVLVWVTSVGGPGGRAEVAEGRFLTR